MTETVQILGLKELNNALLQIVPEHFRSTVLQKALLAGAKPIVKDAKNRAPRKTGVLAAAIFSYKDRAGSTLRFESRFISVRHGSAAQKKNSDAFYWRFIEFGRGIVTTKKHKSLGTPEDGFFGKSVQAYPAHPFLRPAFESNKQDALMQITKVLAEELDNAANQAKWANYVAS